MPINPFADLLRPYFDLISQDFEHFADEAVLNNVTPSLTVGLIAVANLDQPLERRIMRKLSNKIIIIPLRMPKKKL